MQANLKSIIKRYVAHALQRHFVVEKSSTANDKVKKTVKAVLVELGKELEDDSLKDLIVTTERAGEGVVCCVVKTEDDVVLASASVAVKVEEVKERKTPKKTTSKKKSTAPRKVKSEETKKDAE